MSTHLTRAAFLGATAVAAGAFGAHALADGIPPERLETWRTAAAYQLVHAVLLAALAVNGDPRPWARRLLTGGVLVFAGTLYLLVLLDLPVLGAVTPLGGASLIAGWAALAVAPKDVPTNSGPSEAECSRSM
jgi:uncharacterized membrane protein YgdD (TMEM256/DUF423 family)